jgi:hypothetical protein
MANPTTTVQPGDLIRADLFNQLFSQLAALDHRVTALEIAGGPGGGSVLIISVIPSGPIRVGEEMRLVGQSFGYAIGATRVFVDGIRVLIFKSGSNDQNLVFDVPDIPNVPASGKPVTLSVSNQTTTDVRTIVVLPPQVALGGTVDVGFEGVNPATIMAGQAATFRYKVRSRANQPAQFLIAANVSGPPNLGEWQSQVKVLNDDESENAARTIALDPGQEKFFKVRLTQVPGVPPNAAFGLTTSAGAAGVSATPDSRPFTVGQAADQPDPTITLAFQSSVPPSAMSGNTLSVAQGGAAKVSFLATFVATGNYHVASDVTAGSGWTITLAISTPADFQVTDADLASPPFQRLIEFVVHAQSASATGAANFRVEHVGGLKRTFPVNLARL